jgi:3-dehydroquinate dehydratase type I
MMEIAEKMKKKGADIIKIAVMAKTLNDTFSVIMLAQQLQEKKIPHILIAMGKKGILSRVLTPFLGGTIMFAPLSAKGASASGQLTVKELRKAWGMIKK